MFAVRSGVSCSGQCVCVDQLKAVLNECVCVNDDESRRSAQTGQTFPHGRPHPNHSSLFLFVLF